MASGRITLDRYEAQKADIQKLIAEYQAKIEDKTDKLQELERLTADATKVRSVVQPFRNHKVDFTPPRITEKVPLFGTDKWVERQNQHIAKQFIEIVREIESLYRNDAARQVEAAQRNVLADYGELYQLRRENKTLSDANENLESELNTLLGQLAVPSVRNLIIAVADALIDGQPVPISSGGGGSTSDLPWDGRRPDEEEEAYRRRCLLHASRVVKSARSGYRRRYLFLLVCCNLLLQHTIIILFTRHTPHYENVPFEVPEGWVWTTLGEIFTLQAGKNITAKDISEKQDKVHSFPCYGGNGLRGYVSSYNREGRFPLIGRQGALCGNIKEANGRFYATEHAVVVDSYCKTNIDWVINVLIYLNLNQYATSTAQPGLSVGTINEVTIPIPPLEEQQRISQKLNDWFCLIDQIELGKTDLRAIIKQAKNKILDLAIHGKLVPQDPNDEPAIKLLKRINPDFTPCDNGHYENLTSGWTSTTIKDVCENINGLWKGKKEPFVNVGVIRNANFTKDFKLDYSNIEYIDVEEQAFSQRHLLQGDLIVEKSGGSDNNPVGRAILYEGENRVFSFSNFTMVLRVKDKNVVSSKFLYYYILSKYQKGVMRSMQTQTTGLHNLILDKYLAMPLYLPPYSEQKRIINKIEGIFITLDTIMESL